MQNRKRITYILIAGTLTALMLVVFLAFRGGDETVALETGNDVEAAMVEMAGDYETDIAALQAQVESRQTQNAACAKRKRYSTAPKMPSAASTLPANYPG